MDVYQEAYGFTRLRLLVDVFEGWLGLLVVAVMVGGRPAPAAAGCRGSRWSPAPSLLLGLALSNPDAWIAEHNVERYQETGKVDWVYLQGLSDDAVPELVGLPPQDRSLRPGRSGDEARRPGRMEPGTRPGHARHSKASTRHR